MSAPTLTRRHLAMLHAVADDRAELTASRVAPDLYVDGRCCTDHAASVLLAAAGLVAPCGPAGRGRFRACLTDAGRTALDEFRTTRELPRPGRPTRLPASPCRVGVPTTNNPHGGWKGRVQDAWNY